LAQARWNSAAFSGPTIPPIALARVAVLALIWAAAASNSGEPAKVARWASTISSMCSPSSMAKAERSCSGALSRSAASLAGRLALARVVPAP
jgi:hypothetical protein